jgi:hypothetical protein
MWFTVANLQFQVCRKEFPQWLNPRRQENLQQDSPM